MIREYIQLDHGLNLNTRQDLKAGRAKIFDAKVMKMSGYEIDNENGIVFAAIYKYLADKEVNIEYLAEICWNPITRYYSRFNPIKYPPKEHKNDMSLDNLIGLIYCSPRAAKRINEKLKFPFYSYDDISHDRVIARSFLLRPDVIYYIKYMAGDKSCWLFFAQFLFLRLLSSVREKVSRPTVYQYAAAKIKKLIGMKHEFTDTIWKRYTGWDTSGKALTLIMLDSAYAPEWYKKLSYKMIGPIGALFLRYFTKHGGVTLKPLIEMAKKRDL